MCISNPVYRRARERKIVIGHGLAGVASCLAYCVVAQCVHAAADL
jgi:hypothetical protein